MRNAALARRAEELAAQGAAYVTATVVRAQRPTSARAGNVALITSDGTIQGFVGGTCTEHSVRLFAWTAMQTGEPVLVRVLPEAVEDDDPRKNDDGAVNVVNPCLSGGAIELFLEPTLPIPRVTVVGSKPIAAQIERLGSEFDLDVVAVGDEAASVREGDLAIVIAAHGKGELEALKAGIVAKLPYIGLVASPKRGAALLEELRADGVSEQDLARVKCPAGINIGARTAPEVALTVLAEIIQTRYSDAYTAPIRAPNDQVAPTFAIDPICGMTVPAEPGALQLEHAGETVYFCAPGCKKTYETQRLSGPPPSSPDAPAPTGMMPTDDIASTPSPGTATTAVDPICGMTVLATDDTPQLEHEGATVYFCRDECKATFQREQHAVGAA